MLEYDSLNEIYLIILYLYILFSYFLSQITCRFFKSKKKYVRTVPTSRFKYVKYV